MITGGLTFCADCSGFFHSHAFQCFFFLFHAILLLFHGSVILPLCYFSSVSSTFLLLSWHRKLAYAAVDPLSIYAFIFSPHASLKYLIPLSFFMPSCSNHFFPQVLDRWLTCNLSLSWCSTHETEILSRFFIWRSSISFLLHITTSTASPRTTGHNSPYSSSFSWVCPNIFG